MKRKRKRGGSAAVAARRRLLEEQWKAAVVHACTYKHTCTHDVNGHTIPFSEVIPTFSANTDEDSGHTRIRLSIVVLQQYPYQLAVALRATNETRPTMD